MLKEQIGTEGGVTRGTGTGIKRSPRCARHPDVRCRSGLRDNPTNILDFSLCTTHLGSWWSEQARSVGGRRFIFCGTAPELRWLMLGDRAIHALLQAARLGSFAAA